jgi:hypothetical protein
MGTTTRASRTIALGAAVALTIGLLPGLAAAEQAQPRDTSVVCDGHDGAAGSDIAGNTHEAAIRCVAGMGVAAGFEDGTYRPDRDVTRGQMATFVARFLLVAEAVPDEVFPLQGGSFTDTAGHAHEAGIELLAELGIIQGRADGSFGPGEAVNRGQMARFLSRAIDQAHSKEVDGSQPPAPTTTGFADARGNTFADDIEQLRELGIYLGDSSGRARPTAAVTRAQMASFLTRTASYLDELRRWRPTYEPIVHQVPLSWANVTDGEGNYCHGE